MHSQLIHGKFCGENSGYKLVACTSDYENNTEFIHTLFKNHHFWGAQGVEDGRAIGIFLLDANRLVLVKAALAEDEKQELLLSGVRTFYQHHYILIDRKDKNIEILETNPIYFLLRFLDQTTPYFADFNQPIYPQSADGNFWGQLTSEIFQPASSIVTTDRAKNIKQFSDDTNDKNQSFLLLTLGAILHKQKIILTIDFDDSDPIDLLSNLLLLLPASYRSRVAIAIGTVEENYCTWADIIIKTDKEPAYPLSKEFIWLDRSRKKVVGKSDLDLCNHRYLNDFVKNIYQQSEDIYRFIQHLDSLPSSIRDFTRDDLQQASDLIYLIAGLPAQYHAELWRDYIPEIYESHSSAEYWQLIINNFKSSKGFWQASLKLYQEQKENIPIALNIILSVIQKVEIDQTYEKLEELKQIEGLPYALVKINLLNIYPDEVENSILNQHLVDICKKSIEYIRDRYLVQNSIEEFDSFIALLEESDRYQKLFPSAKEEFEFLSHALKPELSTEITKIIFNQYLISKLPYVNKQFFNSDLYKQTFAKFSSINNWAKYFTTEQAKSFDYLPAIAQELELNHAQADLMYSSFLNVLSPQHENAYDILIIIIQKAITSNKEIEDLSNIDIRLFPNQISMFSKTYQWFKNSNNKLKEILISIDNEPEKWHNWDTLITFIRPNLLDHVLLAEFLLRNNFSNKLLLKWLAISKTVPSLKTTFFNSYTWKNLNVKTILDLTKYEDSQWTKFLTHLVIDRFPQDEKHLQNIIPTLLNYLCQMYLEEKNLSIEDRELWKRLIEPSFLQYLSNYERLNIFPLKWHLEIYSDFIITSQPLDETQQKALYSIAKNKFNLTGELKTKLKLFKDIYKYIAKKHLKKLAIDLLEFCSNSNEVIKLVKLCQKFDFDNQDIKEILTKVNQKICDHSLLDLFFSCLESQPINEYDKKIINILLSIPTSNQEQNYRIGICLRNYIYKCEDINLFRFISGKLVEQQYLTNGQI